MKYYLKFGSGDPRTYSGMNCTFLIFESGGVTLTPPAIAEDLTGSGIYSFSWGTTTSVAFLADAATTSPGTALRYITGSLDPSDRIAEYGTSIIALGVSNIALGTTNVALGTSNIAIGVTNLALDNLIYTLEQAIATSLIALGNASSLGLGSTASSMGGISIMPTDIFGYMRRIDALLEGQEAFGKGTGLLSMYDKSGATLLSQRTITNNISLVTKI